MTGLPVWGRQSAESCASLCPTPAGCPAGISFPPVARNGIAGAGEPFLVATELFQRFRGKELRAVAGGMAERFQQTCHYESGNLVRFKTKKPCRLACIKPGGNDLPTEKFRLLRGHIHTALRTYRWVDGRPRGRRNTGIIWPAFKSFRVRRGRISATSTLSA